MKTYESIIDPNAVDAYLDGVDFRSMSQWEADRFLAELGLPAPDRGHLVSMASSSDPIMRWKAAQERFLPAESLRTLASDESNEIRAYVASHLMTPDAVLAQLAMDGDELVRASAASNKHTPSRVLASLARDPHASVRLGLLDNSEAEPALLDDMVFDPDTLVRMTLAGKTRNPTVIRQLADDADSVVVAFLASNPSTPLDVLREIFEAFINSTEECVPWVMVNLAVHPGVDNYILLAISEGRVEEAREVAVARLGGSFIR